MKPVYAQMHVWASVPFVWGESDCALGLADWYLRLHGADPAAHLRGAYMDAPSCQKLCGWFSNPVAVIEDCLSRVGGLDRAETPQVGDVAVITIPGEGRPIPAGALWLGTCWGCKGPSGATTVAARATVPTAIWRMTHAA